MGEIITDKKALKKERWKTAGYMAIAMSTGLVGLLAFEAAKGVVKLAKKKKKNEGE